MVCEVSQNPGPSLHRRPGHAGGDFQTTVLDEKQLLQNAAPSTKIDRHEKLIERDDKSADFSGALPRAGAWGRNRVLRVAGAF
jgi:hypothetical protein